MAEPARPVRLSALVTTFGRLGSVTFGGSMSGWIFQEVVDRRGWIDRQRFLTALTLAQILPGANPVNLAVIIGHLLRGALGSVVAVVAMIAPALGIALCLTVFLQNFGQLQIVQFVLSGLAAAGVGLTLTTGLKTAATLPRTVGAYGIALIVFLLIGILRWPMTKALVILIPMSLLWSYWSDEPK